MKVLEERFGKKHPALEEFSEPPRGFEWLVDSFFRLHRRRQHAEHGFQPIPYQEMADYAERVLKLDPSLHPVFFLAMEETDNAVLYDHYTKAAKGVEEAKEEIGKKPRPRKTPRRR